MIFFSALSEPESFIEWKKKNKINSWSDFSKTEEYQKIRNELILHQDKMCCYCEIALINEYDAHIEHLKDRDKFPNNSFDFHNFLASCKHNDSCGHKKRNGYFSEMVTPFCPDCQSRFTYTANGKIIPANENDEIAERTIDLLGLNCKRLKDRRKSIIKDLGSDYYDYNYLTKALANCVEWYNGFYTVIESLQSKKAS